MESSTIQSHNASTTRETAVTDVDVRKGPFGVILHGVALGLPIPLSTDLHTYDDGTGGVDLRMDDGNTDAVNRWAAFLSLPMPAAHPHVYNIGRKPWQSFETKRTPLDRLPLWDVHVWCTVDATADAVAAAREVAAQRTSGVTA